jgi:hypothetical protein
MQSPFEFDWRRQEQRRKRLAVEPFPDQLAGGDQDLDLASVEVPDDPLSVPSGNIPGQNCGRNSIAAEEFSQLVSM